MATQSPLVDLATVLQTMFLGSGKNTGEVSSTKTGADAGVIDQLQKILGEAANNSSNPDAVKPIIDNILKQATVAFAPQLAREAAGGMFNSSVKQQLASQAAGDAAGAAAGAVLNYKTGQQQIASQVGKTLTEATKTTAATGNQQVKTPPAVSGGLSSAALGGLGLASLYKKKDDILKFVTGEGNTPVDLISNPDVLSTVMGADFAAGQAALDVPAWADITQNPDLYQTVMGGGDVPREALQHVFDNIGDYVPLDFGDAGIKVAGDVIGDVADVTGEFASAAGDAVDITELLGGVGDFAGDIFDEILNFF